MLVTMGEHFPLFLLGGKFEKKKSVKHHLLSKLFEKKTCFSEPSNTLSQTNVDTVVPGGRY